MGGCNYCVLKAIKKRKPPGAKIKVIADKDSGMGGFNVYQINEGETLNHNQHFMAWLMELSEECVC